MCLFCALPHSFLFLLFSLIARKHWYSPLLHVSPRKTYTHSIFLPPVAFSHPFAWPELTHHLWCLVEHCKMSCSPSLEGVYQELSFICSLLALPSQALFWLMIIYLLLVLKKCLELYKPENEGCLSSRKLYRTRRWNSPFIILIFTDKLYSVLPFFSNNLWEVGLGFFKIWNDQCLCEDPITNVVGVFGLLWSLVVHAGHAQITVITLIWAAAGPFFCR